MTENPAVSISKLPSRDQVGQGRIGYAANRARKVNCAAIIGLLAVHGTHVLAQTCSDPNVICLFATSVPDVCGWDFEQRAQGQPATSVCDDSNFPYAVQSSGFVSWGTNCNNLGGACSADFSCSCGNSEDCECFLEATQFGNYVTPSGMAIRSVLIDVQARYNHQTAQCNADAGQVRVRAQLPSLGISTTIDSLQFRNDNGNNDDICRYRLGASGDITSNPTLALGGWTAALVNDLQIGVRRIKDGGKNTALRVNAFRIMIVHCPDCNADGRCDSCEGQPNGTPCENDGNACTIDVCASQCCTHPLLNCDDSNPCTDSSCNPATGCVVTPNSTPCDDGNACTINDACSGGGCVAGQVRICNDNNPCTTDSCNAATGCVYTPNTVPCSDGNPCTTGETCSGGTCGGGSPFVCNDANPCTTDSCNPATGCVFVPNTLACNDGNACTINDTCAGGACLGTTRTCEDNNVCTANSCNPTTGCQFPPVAGSCNDNNACTINDTCSNGGCTGSPRNCNDTNPCTSDTCNPTSGCINTNNTATCSDGNACTTNDRCSSGVCVGGPSLVCNDSKLCTDDSCHPTNGCVFVPNTLACNDGNSCTTNDKCTNGVCMGGTPPVCNDGNLCTSDTCDPQTGCVYTPNTTICNDGNPCTTNDKCQAGVCVGLNPTDCDDNNPCTIDSCDPSTSCTHTNNTSPCNDGDACTVNDTCSGGTCHGGSVLICNDNNACTSDSCNPSTGCVYSPNNLPCNDGNLCTTNDSCSGGTCTSGPALNCSDGNICTTDTCDPGVGCIRSNNTLTCSDGNVCTVGDRCNNGNCQAGATRNCDDGNPCTFNFCSSQVGCLAINNSASCNDGNECTVGDRCVAGQCRSGTPKNCSDDGMFCNGMESCNSLNGNCESSGNPCTGAMPVCCESAKSCVGACEGGFDFDANDDGNVDLLDYSEFEMYFDGP